MTTAPLFPQPTAATPIGVIQFFVPGNPQAKGDHSIGRTKDGRMFIRDQNPKGAPWREGVKAIAREARGNRPLFEVPVFVTLRVIRVRPQTHYGKRGGVPYLKPDAPPIPGSAPDLDKLQRSIGDALNGVLWRDDALISNWSVKRRWGAEAGIRITVQPDWIGEDET